MLKPKEYTFFSKFISQLTIVSILSLLYFAGLSIQTVQLTDYSDGQSAPVNYPDQQSANNILQELEPEVLFNENLNDQEIFIESFKSIVITFQKNGNTNLGYIEPPYKPPSLS